MVNLRTTTTWVPLKIHVFQNNDGASGTKTEDILEMICAVNDAYADQDIQFYIHEGFNFIKSTSVNANPNFWNPTAQPIIMSNKVVNAVNVYITKEIPSDPGSTFQSAGYYQPGFDFVVIKRDQANAANYVTLSHELGHFFTLPHPFLGWPQDDGWNEMTHGNPAPATSPQGIPTELMNGSNCSTAGDGFCDTPPSYNFGGGWAGCNYSGGAMDPNGVLVDPAENNIMDYFGDVCASVFTDEQKAAIMADVIDRDCSTTGLDNTPITELPNLIYPIDGETTPAWNVVGFDWDPVPGATGYIVEVDKQNTLFGWLPSVKFVYGGTYVEFEGIFEADKVYDWRVYPINAGYTCAAPSTIGKFRTGESTSTNNIDEVLNYSIAPNPVSSKENLMINIETSQSFDATISVFDLAGQRIINLTQNFTSGVTNFELSVKGLNEGMYILSIESESGVLNEKIMVTK